jgi:hypothetical protein
MLDSEVPQEGNSTLGGHRKAMYARGEDGKLHIVQSAGWEVEEIVTGKPSTTSIAWPKMPASACHRPDLAARIPHAPRAHGRPLLSQATGLWQWRIRRHFRPDIFQGLSDGLLQRYADAMGMSVEQLKKAD